MSDTPRTDAQDWTWRYPEYHETSTKYVPINFARELERALNAAHTLLVEASNDEINLRDELEKWERDFGHLTRVVN